MMTLIEFINSFQILEMRLGCNKTQPEALIEIIYESIKKRFPQRGVSIFAETMERYISNKLEIKPNIELYGHPPLGESLIFSCLSEVDLEQFKSWFVLMEYRLGVSEKSRQPEELIEFFYGRVKEAYPTRGLAIIGKAFDLYAAGKLEVSKDVTFAYHPPITEKLMFSILGEVNANEAERERERHVLENNSFDVEKKEMEVSAAVSIVNVLLAEYATASKTDLRWVFWKEAFRVLYKKGIIFDYVSGSIDFESGEVLTAKEVCERAALRAQNTYLDDLKRRATSDKDLKNELFIIQNSPEDLRRAASIQSIRNICDLIIENTKTINQ